MEVESAKEVTEEESNAKQISKGDVIVAVVAGTTKYPRRERVKTKRTDSRIGLSCKEYNMKFAKDDSWAKKQVLKERANEKVRGVTPVRRSTRVAGAIKEKTPAHIREEMENMLSM